MRHEHADLIIEWANNTSVKFEYAFGAGVDYVWSECGIDFVINNNNSTSTIRIKKCKGTVRFESFDADQLSEFNSLCLLFRINNFDDKISFLANLTDDEFKQVLLRIQHNLEACGV